MASNWQDDGILNALARILPGVNSRGENAREDYNKWKTLLGANKMGPPDPSDPRRQLTKITDLLVERDPVQAVNVLKQAVAPKPRQTTDTILEREHFLALSDPDRAKLNPADLPADDVQRLQFLQNNPEMLEVARQLITGRTPTDDPPAARLVAEGEADNREPSELDALTQALGGNAERAANMLHPTPNTNAAELAQQGGEPWKRWVEGQSARADKGVTPQSAWNETTEKGLGEMFLADQAWSNSDAAVQAQAALDGVVNVLDSEYLNSYFGSTKTGAWARTLAPGKGRDFTNALVQVQTRELMDAIQNFPGQISDRESDIARSAQATINDSRSSPEEAREALMKIRDLLYSKIETQKYRAGATGPEDYRKRLNFKPGAYSSGATTTPATQTGGYTVMRDR